MALYMIIPQKERLSLGLENLDQFYFTLRSNSAVLEIAANLSASEDNLIERGTYPYTPLKYHSGRQYFNGTGLHPKLMRSFAVDISSH